MRRRYTLKKIVALAILAAMALIFLGAAVGLREEQKLTQEDAAARTFCLENPDYRMCP